MLEIKSLLLTCVGPKSLGSKLQVPDILCNFFSKITFLKFPTIQVILSMQKFLGLNFWVFGYSTHHYFQHLHLPKLYFTMDYVVFICNVLYFQCISMDSIGYYYKYFGKILPSWNHLCFMDFNDLYGNLYTIDISSYLVFTEKSK